MDSYDKLSLNPEEYQNGWLEAYERTTQDSLWKKEPIEFLSDYVSVFKSVGVHSVLDAGCGDGRNSSFLLCNGFSVTGMDISMTALRRALALTRSSTNPNLCLIQGDVEILPKPFPENLFDAVVCLDVFGQFLKIDQVVSGFHNLVRNDGVVLVNAYTPADVSATDGTQVGPKSRLYKGTLFRVFDKQDVLSLFHAFDVLKLEHCHWADPPHPGYRDYPHEHDSYVLLLRNKK